MPTPELDNLESKILIFHLELTKKHPITSCAATSHKKPKINNLIPGDSTILDLVKPAQLAA